MIIESTGTPALYLGFTLLVIILLAVDFLGYLGSDIWGQSKKCCSPPEFLCFPVSFYSDPK